MSRLANDDMTARPVSRPVIGGVAAASLVGVLVAGVIAALMWRRKPSRNDGAAAPTGTRPGQRTRRVVPSAADIHVA